LDFHSNSSVKIQFFADVAKKLEISIVPIWYKNGTKVCVFSLYLKLFAKKQNVLNIEKIFLKTYFGYKPPPGNPSLRDFWGEYRILR